MSRPTFEVADIVREHGARFIDRNRHRLSYQQLKVITAIGRCRTAALGGHIDDCPRCGYLAISYNSCRNRHCPKCQAQARKRWIAARETELLNTTYFHVVFTLPHELVPLCPRNQRLLYDLLFQTSAATMLEVAAEQKHLGAEIGFLSILHTWGQNLALHPHVHCIVPAGGFNRDHTHWVHPRYKFFLPVKVLAKVFRGKFLEVLKRLYTKGILNCSTANLHLPDQFKRFIDRLYNLDWVVYAKPAMGGGPQVLRYLGRYTHRVAISNHRLVAYDDEQVTFRWKDYAHGNKQRKMTLSAEEFLRRFLQHVLPRGFVRIRHFGYLANHHRTARQALARQLITNNTLPREPRAADPPSNSSGWRCPTCGAPMHMGAKLTAVQLRSRCTFNDSS